MTLQHDYNDTEKKANGDKKQIQKKEEEWKKSPEINARLGLAQNDKKKLKKKDKK